jgi:hypothetical protein
MQFESQKSVKTLLLILLGIIGVGVLLANLAGQDYPMLVTNLADLGITAPLVFLSILLVVKNGIAGNLGKAWACFAVFTVLWFVADTLWTVYEMIYQIDPFPSEADFFWLVGYPVYFLFTIFYLRPFKNSISYKIIAVGICTSAVLLTLFMYVVSTELQSLTFEDALAISYPIADAIILVPTIAGLSLFFRGQVGFLWSSLLFGMLSTIVGDIGFQVLTASDQYYTGHPVDIPYLWAYVFFAFGIYSHLKIFRTRNSENQFNDQENLR